jgi:drug/metabolite transporter (DMT)-like permease
VPLLCVLATVWLWSLIPLAMKVAYGSFNSGFIGFTRLAIGTCCFALWEVSSGRSLKFPAAAAQPRLPGPRGMTFTAWVVLAGLGIGGDLLLYALGLRYTTASAATLIVSTDGVILALLGVLILHERMSWMKAAAGVTALGGLFLVGWSGQDLHQLLASSSLFGNAVVLSAGCCWATYGLGQRVLARVPGGSLFWVFLVGTILATFVAFSQPIAHAPLTWKPVGALLYLGVGGTGLAYVLLVRGMAKLEAATVGVVCSLLPVFTMVQAHYFRGEVITIYLIGGAVLVITGVLLIIRHQRVYGAEGRSAGAERDSM